MKEKRPLGITDAERLSFYLRINVPVSNEQIGPAVVIEIKKLCAKPEERNADRADSRCACNICELTIVIVMVEIVGIVGEIRFHNVGPAIAIIVSSIDAHARLFSPVGTVSHARFGADLRESAFAVIVVKQAGRGIV